MRSAGFEEPSDGELVRGARSGDVAALGALLGRHRAGMQAVALSLLGNRPDAEDAVQDAWLIAFRRIGDLREPESAGAWLRMIVRNVCLSRLRSAPTTMPFVDLSPPVAECGPEQVVLTGPRGGSPAGPGRPVVARASRPSAVVPHRVTHRGRL
ncbi:RNA polymerase sigma factor [Streptomyces tendae]|uniref:RNA polymerase sigma factor n=1 Tax=Streptomyces tendae TaxID=1932 RepID=UPI003211DE21